MKIYVAGKITGEEILPCYNKFQSKCVELQNELALLPKNTINPLRISGIHFGISHEEAMRLCFEALKSCTHAYFLKDWKDSKGAKMEHQFCIENGIKIMYEK